MSKRENILRAIRFERPDHIPVSFHINPACWHHYAPEALFDLMDAHPLLFPGFDRKHYRFPTFALNQRKDEPYTDPWGCVWRTSDDGITGSVVQHPLSDWRSFDSYIPPRASVTDGTYPIDWQSVADRVARAREAGDIVQGSLPHGHTFLRLQDIRGYENLIFDMLDRSDRLVELIAMVEEFNSEYVERWMALEPDMMSYPEDLGMQVGPMLSPEQFRTYIKPVYQRLMAPARKSGCVVHMHSDGDIRTLVDDLIDGGVEVINLQDLVNGIDWIAERFAGRTCIDLDIDRQSVTAKGTPRDIDSLVREEVEKLGSTQGGLMMVYGLYPNVPVENVGALMDAMERYAGHYS